VGPYMHFRIRLHGVVLNWLGTGTTLHFTRMYATSDWFSRIHMNASRNTALFTLQSAIHVTEIYIPEAASFRSQEKTRYEA
jgi:hypothetical protein